MAKGWVATGLHNTRTFKGVVHVESHAFGSRTEAQQYGEEQQDTGEWDEFVGIDEREIDEVDDAASTEG